jgi:hypothetical protein
VRVLLDHCVPKQFGFLLAGHHVRTTHYMSWDALENGELLTAASGQFDTFLALDGDLAFQQHANDLPITVISLVAVSNELADLSPLAAEVLVLLATNLQRRVYVVGSR